MKYRRLRITDKDLSPFGNFQFIAKHNSKKGSLEKMVDDGTMDGDRFYDLIAQLLFEGISCGELHDILTKAKKNCLPSDYKRDADSNQMYLNSMKKVIDLDRVILELEEKEEEEALQGNHS